MTRNLTEKTVFNVIVDRTSNQTKIEGVTEVGLFDNDGNWTDFVDLKSDFTTQYDNWSRSPENIKNLFANILVIKPMLLNNVKKIDRKSYELTIKEYKKIWVLIILVNNYSRLTKINEENFNVFFENYGETIILLDEMNRVTSSRFAEERLGITISALFDSDDDFTEKLWPVTGYGF